MKHLRILFSCIALLLGSTTGLSSQNTISSKEGYSPQIGILVDMLDDLKNRITGNVRNLTQKETDFLLDEKANRMGALILHLAATEKYYQVYTFENRTYNAKEAKQWRIPMNLGEKARKELVDKPISYYLKLWDEVRQDTYRLLKTKDDQWLAKKISGSSMNNHWAWYHVMEHQANHMGQIQLLKKRM